VSSLARHGGDRGTDNFNDAVSLWRHGWDKKLDYIHDNPCKGVWNLAMNAIDYPHSSAKYYQTGEQGIYAITSYTYLEDIDLTK
jgi:hypothetical protein